LAVRKLDADVPRDMVLNGKLHVFSAQLKQDCSVENNETRYNKICNVSIM